jgi:hypothetical protein
VNKFETAARQFCAAHVALAEYRIKWRALKASHQPDADLEWGGPCCKNGTEEVDWCEACKAYPWEAYRVARRRVTNAKIRMVRWFKLIEAREAKGTAGSGDKK